jgi:solute carrier family 12 sodium/potassium/chloride transporter 2
MFVIRWYFALATIVIVGALYMFVDILKPDINWGSSTQAFLYAYSMRNLLKLEKLEGHVKNFRPQFLVLTGAPSSRPDMVHFFNQIGRDVGVMVCGHVLLGNYTENRRTLLQVSEQQRKWLRREKVKAFCNVVSANTLQEGVRSLLQLTGLGKLRPNTIVVGYKRNWERCSEREVEDYVALLHDAFDLNFGVVIFRLRAGFDATEKKDDTGDNPEVTVGGHAPLKAELSGRRSASPSLDARKRNSTAPLLEPTEGPSQGSEFTEIPLLPLAGRSPASQRPYHPLEMEEEEEDGGSYHRALSEGRLEFEEWGRRSSVTSAARELGRELVTMPSRFEQVQQRGTIDVWWIYDDGGLAILLPYLLSRHPIWKNCKLRIFTGASSRGIDKAKLRMTSLLQKFRISFSEVIEVTGIGEKPSMESVDRYRQLPVGSSEEDDKELDKLTNRHIRLGELLREHSSNARMIVMTISVPQRGVPSQRYMSWLETMSRDLPPILLMRGNQTTVLTFYS